MLITNSIIKLEYEELKRIYERIKHECNKNEALALKNENEVEDAKTTHNNFLKRRVYNRDTQKLLGKLLHEYEIQLELDEMCEKNSCYANKEQNGILLVDDTADPYIESDIDSVAPHLIKTNELTKKCIITKNSKPGDISFYTDDK